MTDFHAVAEAIADHGVTRLFGVPGSGPSLTLIDALDRKGIPFHLTQFEGAAAVMAGTVGRLSNRTGVAIGIKGPGLANMVCGLAACSLETFPLVAIVEAYPPHTPEQKVHKRLDHAGLVGAVAKGSRFVSENGPGFAELAAWSLAEAPGPVLLEIAEYFPSDQPPVPEATPRANATLVEYIMKAKRPAVIAGALAIRRGWSEQINGLRLPVFTTAAAKGVVDETKSHASGVFTGVGLSRTPESVVLPEADLVVGLGLRTNEVLAAKPFHSVAVNIDPLGDGASAGFNFAAAGEPADTGSVFALLQEKVWGLELVERAVAGLRRYLLDQPFLPAHVFNAVARRFDGRVRMVLDTGYFCTVGEHAWSAQRAEWFLGSGQGRYMGIGLPMAVAAALQDPTVPTVLALGDGGIGPFFAELKRVTAAKLPILIILMSDGGFGSVRSRAIRDGLRQEFLLMSQPSWRSAIEGLGIPAVPIDDEVGLEHALAAWNPSSGPLYIEAAFDPEAYQRMVDDIR